MEDGDDDADEGDGFALNKRGADAAAFAAVGEEVAVAGLDDDDGGGDESTEDLHGDEAAAVDLDEGDVFEDDFDKGVREDDLDAREDDDDCDDESDDALLEAAVDDGEALAGRPLEEEAEAGNDFADLEDEEEEEEVLLVAEDEDLRGVCFSSPSPPKWLKPAKLSKSLAPSCFSSSSSLSSSFFFRSMRRRLRCTATGRSPSTSSPSEPQSQSEG